MVNEITRLEEQLRRALEGEAWHGPSALEALAVVSAEQASSHPIPDAHNIREFVLHISSDYTLVLRRLAGDGRPVHAGRGLACLSAGDSRKLAGCRGNVTQVE